jgi:hypothetical protein
LAFQRPGRARFAPINEHGEIAFLGFKAPCQHLAGRAATGILARKIGEHLLAETPFGFGIEGIGPGRECIDADIQAGEQVGAADNSRRRQGASILSKPSASFEAALDAAPDKQVLLTDPDTRLMVIGDRLTGVVGYNVQTAVDTEHHLIIAREVTNQVVDRGQLPKMAAKVKTDVFWVSSLQAETSKSAHTAHFSNT